MGRGFGSVIIFGQIILDHDTKPSIEIADIVGIPAYPAGLLAIASLGKLFFSYFIVMSVPALVVSLIGVAYHQKVKSGEVR